MYKGRTKPFQLKSLDSSGTFTGYAAKYGNVDHGGDLIMPGAFADFLSANGGGINVPVLWQHDSREPIGSTVSMKEDNNGLLVEGQLVMEVQRAREAHALAKQGILGGLSIGYSAKDWMWDNGVRILKSLDLHEYSLVTFPMNDQAAILDVKSAELKTLGDCEAYLRDAFGLSRSEAKTFVSRVVGAARVDVGDSDDDESKRIRFILDSLDKNLIKG